MSNQTRKNANILASFRSIGLLGILIGSLFVAGVFPVVAATGSALSMQAVSVVPHGYVIVVINNLPSDVNFTVREGPSGSLGIGGSVIAHFNSGDGGTKYQQFELHASVRDLSVIVVRIEGDDGEVAFTAFANTARVVVSPSSQTVIPVTGGTAASVPSAVTATNSSLLIQAVSVVPHGYVTVKISNLPSNATFTVREGPAGTRGIGGSGISHFNSGNGGTVYLEFELHANVRDLPSIDIRIEGDDGQAAFANFPNRSNFTATTTTTTAQPGNVLIPLTGGASAVATTSGGISVLSVQQGGVVKVEMFALSQNVDYDVRMSAAGDKINTYHVANVSLSPTLTTDTSTFEIPTPLKFDSDLTLYLIGGGQTFFITFPNININN